ncbi:MAG: NAD(P)H-binding protein [Gammaproteobacteria bacterium]|nr:NAD(P)H-binding protein [Gammaproteobacteria bacterium]
MGPVFGDAQPRLSPHPRRVFLLGATGTIGRAVARALVERGHEVVCFVRARAGVGGSLSPPDTARLLDGTTLRFGDLTDGNSLVSRGFMGERFDVLISCLASRTGVPADAWAIDHRAHVQALDAARAAGVGHVVLLSAICVQKPRLAFQHAKLAFEQTLIESGVRYSIVRPTAYFKSLSGQVERLKRGKPFVVFGDGQLTACKPVSDRDLAHYLADCLDQESRHDRVLPIGGPGEAVTPLQQGEHLFALLGRPPKFRHVPVKLLDAVQRALHALGKVSPAVARKAELARIGRYYATESMLVLDPVSGRYDASMTPSTGSETLFDYYARLIASDVTVERGDHAVF